MYTEKVMIIAFVLVLILMAALIAVIALLTYRNHRRQTNLVIELNDVRNRYDQEILKTTIEVQEQTLEHISREIHDNIGQYMTLAKLHINVVAMDSCEQQQNKLQIAGKLLGEALEDIRDLTNSMSLDTLKASGLSRAIDGQLRQLKKAGLHEVRYVEKMGSCERLEHKTEIVLFRIVQEAITNIARHASAKNVEVRLICGPSGLSIEIMDDGIGISTGVSQEGTQRMSGRGLNNMQTRAKLLGGEFKIESDPGFGTRIIVALPFQKTP
jgi:two-component system NarL family sensor kinase